MKYIKYIDLITKKRAGKIRENEIYFTENGIYRIDKGLKLELHTNSNSIIIDKDQTLSGNSDLVVSSQKAVKVYIDTNNNTKQDVLVSGINIKTVNGTSLLGSGDIVISGEVSNGDKGDITVSESGNTWTIDNLAVTNAKINDVAATKVTEDSSHRFVTDSEKSTWNAKESAIASGLTSQYWRGDKTWQTLDKSSVGLNNVANVDTTTTANITDSTNKKFITDAQQTVLNNTSGTNSGNETASSIGSLINSSTAATPNDTDLVATAESSVLKKITWTNVKAFLKTYFDTLYQAAGSYLTSANISDAAYGPTWNGDTTTAPSKNAIYDKIESMSTSSGLEQYQVRRIVRR